ncbi:AMP nucleosidase, partial [Rhizobium ruizarguesonis]
MNKRISPLSPLDISSPPPFQPQSFDDPAKAVETLTALYERNTAFLIQSFAELAQGAPISSRYRAFYPQVSIETTSFGHVDSRLSYGHVTAPGIYTTTVTRPKLFKHYLNEQLALLMKSHNIPVIVSESTTPIPLHFAFGEGAHVEASTNAFVDIPMRDIFDTPDLNTTDDEIANGEYIPPPGEPSPLAPFTAQRIDYSLARLSHYTATHAEHFQNFVLFTNYQFYIDEFCSWARKLMAEDSDGYTAFVEPGNVVTLPGSNAPETDAALTRLPQMPAYHLKKKGHAGITMINIGVGPSNAKTITDHVAVLRPHAWLMLGHCAGLRNSQ